MGVKRLTCRRILVLFPSRTRSFIPFKIRSVIYTQNNFYLSMTPYLSQQKCNSKRKWHIKIVSVLFCSKSKHRWIHVFSITRYFLGLNRYSVPLLGLAEYQILGNTRYSVVTSLPKPGIKTISLNNSSFT